MVVRGTGASSETTACELFSCICMEPIRLIFSNSLNSRYVLKSRETVRKLIAKSPPTVPFATFPPAKPRTFRNPPPGPTFRSLA